MGSCLSQKYNIAMAGLEGSGKTALLYRMKLHAFMRTVPTIGLNAELISYRRSQL